MIKKKKKKKRIRKKISLPKTQLCLSTGKNTSDWLFSRLTICLQITDETKEERESRKHPLCSMGSHMCADRSADFLLSELVSVGWPPAHTGPWAAALRCICVGLVSSFSWKQQGSSLPWEFPWTANISYLTYTESKIDLVFWENLTVSQVFMVLFSRLCLLSLSVLLLFWRFCQRVYSPLSFQALRSTLSLCQMCLPVFHFSFSCCLKPKEENVHCCISNLHILNPDLSLVLKWKLFIQVL